MCVVLPISSTNDTGEVMEDKMRKALQASVMLLCDKLIENHEQMYGDMGDILQVLGATVDMELRARLSDTFFDETGIRFIQVSFLTEEEDEE